MQKQVDVREIHKALAKKYNLTSDQIEQIIDLRFELLREKLKESDIYVNHSISIRLSKFAMFYIPKKVANQRRQKAWQIARRKQEKLNREANEQNRGTIEE